jgi:ribose/xylose/arabinose/galactoside ABC-type transport system permease subunit
MSEGNRRRRLAGTGSRIVTQYGMLGVLLLLAVFFSLVTIRDQHPTGGAAGKQLARRIAALAATDESQGSVIAVVRGGDVDQAFLAALDSHLSKRDLSLSLTIAGEPPEIREQLEAMSALELGAADDGPIRIATQENYAPVVRNIAGSIPAIMDLEVVTPPSYRWPTFLLGSNLLNVANQIAVIAILAIGMTMVIITAGIDLSVGSLIALAAVAVAGLIGLMGGAAASPGAMLLCGAGAVVFTGLIGGFSGFVITRFRVPPFIATLGMMQVASGLAYLLSSGRPIYKVPENFVTLGRGVDPLLGIPYAVILMVCLYLIAHLVMSRTALGRYVYAVGGNEEAARLAGVRVKGVLMFVYCLNGMLAGLGGVIMASQLKSGAPTYGGMYELYVIAAVVVGGTSLSGGQGKILATLIGAFIIAVIQNGMNLTNVESYTQKVVLGLVILGAVLLDRLKTQARRK